MPVAVFLRAANVGGRVFRPKELAETLSDLDVASLGAAGTFVVRRKVAERTLRARIQKELPFEAPVIVCDAAEVRAALAAGEKIAPPEGARRFATVMAAPPAKPPKLPIEAPSGAAWGVRVVALEGRFALGVRRRVDETGVYPNEVVEKAFGATATTRDWPTVEKVGALLER